MSESEQTDTETAPEVGYVQWLIGGMTYEGAVWREGSVAVVDAEFASMSPRTQRDKWGSVYFEEIDRDDYADIAGHEPDDNVNGKNSRKNARSGRSTAPKEKPAPAMSDNMEPAEREEMVADTVMPESERIEDDTETDDRDPSEIEAEVAEAVMPESEQIEDDGVTRPGEQALSEEEVAEADRPSGPPTDLTDEEAELLAELEAEEAASASPATADIDDD